MCTISPMSSGPGPGGTTTGVAVGRVVVVARLQLLAQAVGAALRERGVGAETLLWEQTTSRAGRAPGAGDIVVLLDDLASVQDLVATCDLVAGTPARCVVLTRRPAGPAWGALLAAGTAAVLPADGSLEHMTTVVSRIVEGEPVMDEDRRVELVSAWEEKRAENELLSARVALLSPRERQVLALLSEGCKVVDIATLLGVAETTVRSQIKSIRRKLGVDSQLRAVAMLHRLRQPDAAIPRSASLSGALTGVEESLRASASLNHPEMDIGAPVTAELATANESSAQSIPVRTSP